MRFNENDLKPNKKIPWDQIRVGATSDARWRDVPKKVRVIDMLDACPKDQTKRVR